MQLFIFDRIAEVSCNYHSHGGLVILANDVAHAQSLISEDKCITVTPQEWETVEIYQITGNPEPKYWVMPDAGCC